VGGSGVAATTPAHDSTSLRSEPPPLSSPGVPGEEERAIFGNHREGCTSTLITIPVPAWTTTLCTSSKVTFVPLCTCEAR